MYQDQLRWSQREARERRQGAREFDRDWREMEEFTFAPRAREDSFIVLDSVMADEPSRRITKADAKAHKRARQQERRNAERETQRAAQHYDQAGWGGF